MNNVNTHECIPLVGPFVEAGFPTVADEFIEDRLDLNRYLIAHPAATFFVRVSGTSMQNAGILPGDMVVVDRSLDPKERDIVIAVLDGQFTLKRFSMIQGAIHLLPENPRFPPIKVESEQVDFAIWGVVTSVIRKMK